MIRFGNLEPFASFVKEGWEAAFYVAKFWCFLHVTNTYLISGYKCDGPSMLPVMDVTPTTFLAERISPRFGKVACGDIVTLRSPYDPRKCIVKRVVGMEGDTVTYVPNPMVNDKHETTVVPKGHVWVQGDNIYSSTDSRDFGPVPYGLIQGKMFWRLWPGFGPFWKK